MSVTNKRVTLYLPKSNTKSAMVFKCCEQGKYQLYLSNNTFLGHRIDRERIVHLRNPRTVGDFVSNMGITQLGKPKIIKLKHLKGNGYTFSILTK